MGKPIIIDPVTRIEGHAKITLHLDESGRVEDAVSMSRSSAALRNSARAGRFMRCPSLMARICGICPVSHLMASAKACDAHPGGAHSGSGRYAAPYYGLAQIVQSHALSFFYLSSPDLLLGMDSDPAPRNIFGVLRKQAGNWLVTASGCDNSGSRSLSGWAGNASIRRGLCPGASAETSPR